MPLVDPDSITLSNPNSSWDFTFLTVVVNMGLSLINATNGHGNYLFVERVFCPLISKIFFTAGTPLPATRDVYAYCVNQLFNGYSAIVSFDADSSYYGQAIPKNIQNTQPATDHWITFNTDWMQEALASYKKNVNVDHHTDSMGAFQLNIHMVVACVKFLHEFTHTLTYSMLKYEFECRAVIESQPEMYQNTPTKIGTRVAGAPGKPKTLLGDLGYGFEEIFLSSNFRIFLDTARIGLWKPDNIQFVTSLYGQRPATTKSGTIKKQATIQDYVKLHQIHVPLDEAMPYLSGIRDAYGAYQDALQRNDQVTTSNAAVAFYNSFEVSVNNHFTPASLAPQYSQSVDININSAMKDRTYAPATEVFVEELLCEELFFSASSATHFSSLDFPGAPLHPSSSSCSSCSESQKKKF
jgi:hypothetical protein